MIQKPMDIEKKSFEIIEDELKRMQIKLPQDSRLVTMRVIHTTADFDYAKNLLFSDNVVKTVIEALKNGCDIVTDTNMAQSGINKTVLSKLGGSACCYMGDEDVAVESKERGITRAIVSMEKSARICKENGKNCIYAIGNAPTALVTLRDLIKAGVISPVAIIGVPVGFVNVVEAKEKIMDLDVPYIIAKGRKGGSNVAAAICNALLYQTGIER